MIWDRAVLSSEGTLFLATKDLNADGVLVKRGETLLLVAYKEFDTLSGCWAVFATSDNSGCTVKLSGEDIEYLDCITWHVRCPYCRKNMELTYLDNGRICFRCDDCLSQSPSVRSDRENPCKSYNDALYLANKQQ